MNAFSITITVPIPPPPPVGFAAPNTDITFFLRVRRNHDIKCYLSLGAAMEELIRFGTDNCTLSASTPVDDDYIHTEWIPRRQKWSDWK